ncbi:MAG: nickel pincer cofactor biosynthesis protein LarC [Promethearchaeota archaeon]
MQIIYLDLINSGISGDMLLAALLGLVPEPNKIIDGLKEIKDYLPGVSKLEIELIKSSHSGIQLNKLDIYIKETKNHRSANILKTSLNKFLEEKNLSESAKHYANNVLNSLIQAESEVHGRLINKIHLHELSSVDTLIDIIGVAKVLDTINGFDKNFKIYCSKIPLGGGKIETAHGILTIPAPATLKILEKSNLITYGGPIDSELVTPTGIALLTNLNPKFQEYLPDINIQNSVFSTGEKIFKEFLNILRLFIGESQNLENTYAPHPLTKYREKISILETDVDDISGELVGNFINKMGKEKVLDIQIIPSITKKNRPSNIIKILCYPKYAFELMDKMIQELGTLGIRFNTINRVCIERKIEKQIIEIYNQRFEVNYKVSYIDSEKKKQLVNIKPEYEDLNRISNTLGIPLRKIQLIVQTHLKQLLNNFQK